MKNGIDVIKQDVRDLTSLVDSEFFEGKSVLITGASGLIGCYHFAYFSTLILQGANIVLYGQTFSGKSDLIANFQDHDAINLIKADLTTTQGIESLPSVDIIIHCAGYAQPSRFMKDPLGTLQIGTTATIELLKKMNPDGRLIFMSSIEVYNSLEKEILDESDIGLSTPSHPRSSYIEGKRGGEAACSAINSMGGKAYTIRLGYTYGPGVKFDDQRAMYSFIRRAIVEKEIKLLDSGDAEREYCYVKDALELTLSVLINGKNNTYNLGGNSKTSIKELAELIGKKLDVPVIIPDDDKGIAGAPKNNTLDSSLIHNEFSKSNFITMEEGLNKTIDWMLALHKI
jgi:UDP-glucuronate decarboxylase